MRLRGFKRSQVVASCEYLAVLPVHSRLEWMPAAAIVPHQRRK